MKVLISFYSKTGRTQSIAEEIAKKIGADHEVRMHQIKPLQVLKAHSYNKDGKGIELVEPVTNIKEFDIVFVGTPVWNFCPSPVVISYIRQLRATRGKPFALFSTCTALPGTTIKRMSNILATKNARLIDSISLRSIFDFDREKIELARQFAKKTMVSALE